MWGAISAALAGFEATIDGDDPVRCLIVSSSSHKAFSAGADLDEFERAADDDAFRECARAAISTALDDLKRSPIPSIAEVQGNCFGGGAALALGCDLRLADDSARFAVTPAKVGLVYPLTDTKRLVELVGPAHARALLFTGAPVDAIEARRIGLVNDVVASEALAGEVAQLAVTIAGNAPYSIAAIKELLDLIANGATADSDESRALFLGAYEHSNFSEGLAAFREKRKPDFK